MPGPRKTHCLHGHPRTPENVDRLGACRVCRRERAQRQWTPKGYQEQRRERYRTDPAYREREKRRARENGRARRRAARDRGA